MIGLAIKVLGLTKESEGTQLWVTMMISTETEVTEVVEINQTLLIVLETEEEVAETIETIESIEMTVDAIDMIGKTEGGIDQIHLIQMGQVAHTTVVKIEEKIVIEIEEVPTMENLIMTKIMIEKKGKDQSLIDEMSYNVLFVINQLKDEFKC